VEEQVPGKAVASEMPVVPQRSGSGGGLGTLCREGYCERVVSAVPPWPLMILLLIAVLLPRLLLISSLARFLRDLFLPSYASLLLATYLHLHLIMGEGIVVAI